MRVKKAILVLLISLAFLSACSTTEEKGEGIVDGMPANGNNDASTQGYQDGSGISVEPIGSNGMSTGLDPRFSDPANPLSKRTIYFMFDSSSVQQEFVQVIAAHAQYLVSHRTEKIILEGHADERGSREYNIALGEQRAKAVLRMMKIQGVTDDQVEVVSYGEEKPAVEGMNEAAWQLNRRVEIVYQGR